MTLFQTYRNRNMLVSLLMIGFVAGCNIFETRTAEPPDTGNVGVFMQPDRPEVVLDNLVSSLENLTQ
jgi:hypothetical protein